ncbi:MAG TPA: ATP-binding cassette domain-containing protein [Pyrinomonadaceae bacterium]|jgi:osmoprotectant transport system ATP-binding protein|nr:ATP-binding cassette domain-containing protein [Pyrinomonadaceae bacterium]
MNDAAANTRLVQFHNVNFSLPKAAAPIISDLNFSVARGETLVLLGESGSGKTTTLKFINCLLLPTSGEVFVEGKSTTAWDPIALRRRIGYVIQEGGLFPHFTIAQNVGLVPGLLGWDQPRVDARVEELLSLVGLEPRIYAARFPRELSGGQRQRAGVARALAADPPLLLLDEPFGALDPLTRASLQQEFADLSRRLGKTAILVTHDLREALILATRIGLMHRGRLLLLETPDRFLASDIPQARAYLETLAVTDHKPKQLSPGTAGVPPADHDSAGFASPAGETPAVTGENA